MGPTYDDDMYSGLDTSYFEEEIDGENDNKKMKLFPLSQYKFKDPCEECLVKASCQGFDWCPDKYKHRDWKLYKNKVKRKIPSCWEEWLFLIFHIVIISILLLFGLVMLAAFLESLS